jgi:hypothetical protein
VLVLVAKFEEKLEVGMLGSGECSVGKVTGNALDERGSVSGWAGI